MHFSPKVREWGDGKKRTIGEKPESGEWINGNGKDLLPYCEHEGDGL